jgi:hypothetical protein
MDEKEFRDLMSGPDYFTCERMHCTMVKSCCYTRQEKGMPTNSSKIKYYIPEECKNCTQGKSIVKNLEIEGGFSLRKDIVYASGRSG